VSIKYHAKYQDMTISVVSSDVPLGIFPKECSREHGIFPAFREISLKNKKIKIEWE
jgi:hypothetical protein